MKKVFGITLGGLQKKVIGLVVTMLTLAVLVFGAVLFIKNQMLVSVVEDTRTEQQQAISQTSKAAMDQFLMEQLVSNTELQARIVDRDFSEIVNNTYMLQSMAQELLENRSLFEPAPVSLPAPALDGTSSAMALHEAGVDWTKSEYLGIVANLSAPMIALQQNSEKIDCCYIGLEDGTGLFVDAKAGNKYDENGELITFPIRERPWYRGAVETGGLYFTGILQNVYGGGLMVTCSAPVIVDGKTVGVVGIDISLEKMNHFVSSAAEMGFSYYVVNAGGQVTLASVQNGVFSAELSEDAPDLRESGNEALARFVQNAYEKTTAVATVPVEGKTYYMVASPMPAIGWTLLCAVETEANEQLENRLLAEYDGINETAGIRFASGNSRTNLVAVILLAAVYCLGLAAALYSARRMVSPIVEMTRNIARSSETGEMFEMKPCYRTNDEIEALAEAFDDLSRKTRQYIQDITVITREKERVSTELQMATRIQESMLPSIFPPFPDRKEFDIYAKMDPAREVGGDFYDFFLIDGDHLGMVMADVSGKGVPAALFMMATKIIMQSCAMLGQGAAEILTKTNEAICSNNKMGMFVTAWVGILEISTGRLTAANAGHEYPVIYRNGGQFELFKDRHGFVLGGMAGMKYREYELQLNPGDKLFLYTDGVPEATDANNAMFGAERMLNALNAAAEADPKAILGSVRTAVDAFVKDAEQFDDLTMLCVSYAGAQKKTE